MFLPWMLACGPDATAWPAARADIELVSAAPTFAATVLGATSTADVRLLNVGAGSTTVPVETDGPFTADRSEAELGAGQDLTLVLTFRPTGYADAVGRLDLGGLSVALAGTTESDADGDGASAMGAGGTDCDDADPEVSPDVPEICGDGVDQDCAPGGETDCDGDGAPAPADCDDTDAAVRPGQADDRADGLDDDCDGMKDEDLLVGGELVITEIAPQDPAWIEVCSTTDRTIALDGLTVAATETDLRLGTLDLAPGACAAICASAIADCSLQADLQLAGGTDRLTLAAGDQVLDALAWDDTWGWTPGRVLALDPAQLAADANNVPSAWCVTNGTPGTPNEVCP